VLDAIRELIRCFIFPRPPTNHSIDASLNNVGSEVAHSSKQRFDPQRRYIRRWVPEIARLPDRWIHEPWVSLIRDRSRMSGNPASVH
jgi:hypothetical protein